VSIEFDRQNIKTVAAWLVGKLNVRPSTTKSGKRMKRYGNLYNKIYDLEKLYLAYIICLRGKRLKRGILPFTYNLSAELLCLHRELKAETYKVGTYYSFYVFEPKRRLVQALPFRDRIVQQALCQIITPIFEKTFIRDTFACIKDRGTHAGSNRLRYFIRSAQKRWSKAYCLQCDIASYFPTINHNILLSLFSRKIKCQPTMRLIKLITNSNGQSVGISIGNLLSQLSANLYLSLFDHKVKESWKVEYYLRYMDDFCIIHGSKKYLAYLKCKIKGFIGEHLTLNLNRKTAIFPISQGIDFLGYRTWTTHKLLRKRSIKKMRRKLKAMALKYSSGNINTGKIRAPMMSWIAHCKHADTYWLRKKVLGEFVLVKKN
jgi:RNA-directed DNA polymerase